MLESDMLKFIDDIAVPSTGVTYDDRGMFCMDGLGQHHSFKVVERCDKV